MGHSQSKSPRVTHFMTVSGKNWYTIPSRVKLTVAEFEKKLSEGRYKEVKAVKDRNRVVHEVNLSHTAFKRVPR